MNISSSLLVSPISRYAVFASVALTLLVTFSAVWNFDNIDKQANYLATEEARANWNKDQAFRRWATRHGGLYVVPNDRTPPNPYLEHLPNRDVETTDGVKLTLMNPAYMMSQMTKEFESMYGIKGKITGQIFLNPKNEPDPWELNALKQFGKGVKEVLEHSIIDGQPYIRLMRPMVMKDGCVLCHGHLGFKVGDIRGGVSVSVPLAPYLGTAEESKSIMLFSHSGVWSLGILAIGFVSWRGQKREYRRMRAESQLNEAIESFSSGFALYDKDDRLVLFNSHHHKSVEANAPGTVRVGRTFEELLNDWAAVGAFNISEEDRAEYVATRLRNRGQAPTQFESQLNDGQWVLISEYRTNSDGTAVIITDIGERKLTEEALKASEERLTEILYLAPEAVITIDENMRILLFNKGAERIFGYSADEVVGRPMDFLMPKSARPNHSKYIESFNQSSEDYRLMDKRAEVAGLRKDGSEFPASASVSKLETPDGRLYTVMLQDISDRRQVEEERHTAQNEAEIANRANLAKSEFLSSMSHELRTPLNSILGFSQLLEDDPDQPLSKDQQDSLFHIRNSGRHLLELINDVLDLSKIEAGEVELNIEEISLTGIIEESLRSVLAGADERDIDISVENTVDKAPMVRADHVRLLQVLINLISNAVKYNRENGKVTIGAEKVAGDMLCIAVSDTGEGIPENRQGELFKPFSRLGAENSSIEGTGIGLVVCKDLIERMDGIIGIESEVGRGSTFWFKLPVAKSDNKVPLVEASKSKEKEEVLASGATGTLLYVEDNPANLALMEKIISRIDGLSFISASSGELGIELARISRPDLIILDVNLPGLSGVEVMQQLRNHNETAYIPILALSAAATKTDIENGIEAGFDQYLTKPLVVSEIVDAINASLEDNN